MATGSIKKVSNDSASGYCKMADGTLLQWGNMDGLSFNNQPSLSGYRTMVQSFIDTNYRVLINPYLTGVSNYMFRCGANPDTPNRFTWTMFSGDGTAITTTGRGFNFLAIGRWK